MFDEVAYLRSQALLRLSMARQISDPVTAEGLRSEALAFTLQADRLEEQAEAEKKQ